MIFSNSKAFAEEEEKEGWRMVYVIQRVKIMREHLEVEEEDEFLN